MKEEMMAVQLPWKRLSAEMESFLFFRSLGQETTDEDVALQAQLGQSLDVDVSVIILAGKRDEKKKKKKKKKIHFAAGQNGHKLQTKETG